MPQFPLPEGQACYGAVTLAGGTVLAPEAEFQWQQGCVVQAERVTLTEVPLSVSD